MLQRSLYNLTSLCVCFVGIIAIVAISCGDKDPQSPVDPVSTVDSTPPAAVSDLLVKSHTASSLLLMWTAPGDDGTTGQAAMYDMRFSFSTITDQNWDSATPVSGLPKPKPAGQIESFVVPGLPSATDVFFALKTYDEVQNESDLSTCAMGTTKQEGMAPSAVTDLTANAISDTEFLLTWTAPGDDGTSGTASEYDIRYSIGGVTEREFAAATEAIGEPAPSPGGEPDSFVVAGMSPGRNYFFALKTADEVPNWSKISNNCPGLAFSDYLLADPLIVKPDQIFINIVIVFRTSSIAERAEVNITTKGYVNRQWVDVVRRHLVDASFPAGVHIVTWDWKDDDGKYFSWMFRQVIVKFYLDGVLVDKQTLRLAI